MRKLLLISVFVLTSCGNEKEFEGNESPKTYVSKEDFELVDSDRGLNLHVDYFEDEEVNNYYKEMATAQAKAWGKSLSTGFIPVLKEQTLNDAITSRNKNGESDFHLEMLSDNVANRFRDRCPTTFGKARRLLDVNLVIDKLLASRKAVGLYSEAINWNQDSNINGKNGKKFQSSYSIWKEYVKDKYPMARIGIKHTNETYLDIEHQQPWEYDYSDFFKVIPDYKLVAVSNAWDLESYKMKSYSDFVLAHEIGHYVIDSHIYSEGKINIASVNFNEILAQFISALCYNSHLENRNAILNQIEAQNKYGANIGNHWPTDEKNYEGEDSFYSARRIIDDEHAYNRATMLRYGLSGLIAGMVVDDKFDPDFLMTKVFESISEMKGRKLACRKEDPTCSMTYFSANMTEYSMEQRPYIFTMAEFLEIFTTKIKVPPRTLNMWNHYIKLMNDTEK